jgi:hypothetical protein
MDKLNEKRGVGVDQEDHDSLSDSSSLSDLEAKKYKANNIPYGRSKSEQRDKNKKNTLTSKRKGAVNDKIDEGNGAKKDVYFSRGNDRQIADNESLKDAQDEDSSVKGSKANIRQYRDDLPKSGAGKKHSGQKPKNRQSNLRKGTTKLKEETMSEQINDFVNAIARDDYSKTKEMVGDMVRAKMDQRTQAEVDKIRAEQESK